MSKTIPRIDLDHSSGPAIYVQIAEALRLQILRGGFGTSRRLPTTRALAGRIGVNRNTIVAAYRKLEEWRLARSHVGRGTFALMPEELLPHPAAGAGSPPGAGVTPGGAPRHVKAAEDVARTPAPWTGSFSRALEAGMVARLSATYSVDAAPGTISFAGSFPAPDLLPHDEFRRALARVLKKDALRAFTYGAAQGFAPLREWIADEMTRCGMRTTADEILITNGSQQAIDLIARAFTDPGDLVLVENPTYTGAISAFQSFGARLSGLPLDHEGIVPGAVAASAARGGGKLAYITPSFQNPTSAVLPAERRRGLLDEAAASNLLVVEDDWSAGLQFEGPGPPTLRSQDREGRVLYLSTFAKKLLPGLRVGWIAAERPVIERLIALKQINDCCTSPTIQVALEEFCRSGALARHLPRVRSAYKVRRDQMLAALERWFPAGASWTEPDGGLFLWVRLPDGVSERAVAAEAEERGVLVSRGELFRVGAEGPEALRLTFATERPERIEEGIKRLGAIVKKRLLSRARRRPAGVREAVPLV